MNKKIYVISWEYDGPDFVKLTFGDGDIAFVTRLVFNRSFGAIISAEKDAVIRDFSIY